MTTGVKMIRTAKIRYNFLTTGIESLNALLEVPDKVYWLVATHLVVRLSK